MIELKPSAANTAVHCDSDGCDAVLFVNRDVEFARLIYALECLGWYVSGNYKVHRCLACVKRGGAETAAAIRAEEGR